MLPSDGFTGWRTVLRWMSPLLVLAALWGTEPAAAQLADAPWPSFGRDLQNTGQSPFGEAGRSWQDVSVGTARTGASIAADGTIYVGAGSFSDAALYALNPDSTEQWAFDPERLSIRSIQPLVGPDGTVYIGGEDGNSNGWLYAVHPTLGTEKWQFFAETEPVRVAPAIAADGTIYVAAGTFSSGGNVYAVDPATGNAAWSVSLSDYPTASPTIAGGGAIYTGTADGTLHAIDPAAQEASVLATFSSSVQGIALGPNGTLYATHGNQLVALNPLTGSEAWRATTDLFSLTPPVLGPDGHIFVGVAGEVEGRVYAFDPAGNERWSINTAGLVDAAPAVGSDGLVHVCVGGGTNSQLLALSSSDGTPQWTFSTGGSINYPPARAADGTTYLASAGGLFSIIGPQADVPASPVTVGRVETGGARQQAIVVENTGDADLTITDVALTGSGAGAFSVVEGAGPVTVAPGAQHTVTVAFAPDEGGEWEAELTVMGNAPPATVALTGRAISIDLDPAQLPTPRVGESLDFTIVVPSDFTPQTRSFFYRPAGTETYQEIDLQPTGDVSVLAGTIPGAAMTVRGVEYYASLAAEDVTLTFPRDNPASNPAWLPVQFDQLNPAGSFEPDTYRMISIPAALDDRAPADVFAEYGPYEPERWRVVRWDPQAETYRDLPDLDEVAPGHAFWLITRDGTPFTVPRGKATDASRPYSLVLQPGWNQIGNPFTFPVSLESIDWPVDLEDPVRFDGQAFQRGVQRLQPWTGYFIYNTASSPVTVSIPPVEASSSVTALAAESTAAQAATDPAATMRLSARLFNHDLRDANNIVGMSRGSEAGRDRMDYAEAPPVGDHVRLSILEAGERLAGSFKPPHDEGQWWDVEVTASVDEPFATRKRVQLRLQPRGSSPDGYERYLVDRDAGTAVPLEQGTTTLVLDSDRPTRRLRVIWGTPGFAENHAEGASLETYVNALRPNAPNPFTQSTTIRYEVEASGPVVVAIYNLLGQHVRTLVDTQQDAGPHAVQWDGRDAQGRPVASGVYFSRLRAGSYEATQKLTLVR